MLARLARVFLAVALLAAWQAALQHPIEHVNELGEFVHLHGGHSHEGDSETTLLCDALAALTACAPDASAPALAATQLHELQPAARPAAPRAAEAPPFLSQGPPPVA